MQRNPQQQHQQQPQYQQVPGGYPQAQATGPYPKNNNNNGDDMPTPMMIGAYFFAFLGTAAFIWLIVCAFVCGSACGCKNNVASSVFGEISIDGNGTGSLPFEFIENSSCIELDSFRKTHERGVTVNEGGGYITVIHAGEYWYDLHLTMRFDEHWLPWTPWRLYVGIDGKKSLKEGSSQDILWWASNETWWSDLPVIPHAPADMSLSGITRLEVGQRLSAFVGIPEFCFNCPYGEAMIHGPANLTITHATVSMHMLSPIAG